MSIPNIKLQPSCQSHVAMVIVLLVFVWRWLWVRGLYVGSPLAFCAGPLSALPRELFWGNFKNWHIILFILFLGIGPEELIFVFVKFLLCTQKP